MSSLPVFETTESVIEVLWDIALAFFVVRIAFIYFLATSVSLALVAALACGGYLPALAPSTPGSAPQVLAPAALLASALWARVVASRFEVPRVAGFRLAIGGAALLFAALAGLLAAAVLCGEGRGAEVLAGARGAAGAKWAAVLLAFGLMPLLVGAPMKGRAGYRARGPASRGHEEKSRAAAVPTVNVREKETEQKERD